jgi:L-lactate dehydrogenase
MRGSGDPEVVARTSVVETWEGARLPGPWLTRRAADLAASRAAEAGIAAVSIRRATHIGCLAAYLRPVAERGLLFVLGCSDPSTASVAPYGGTKRIFTPNPLAAAWPAPGGPVMLDVSMSITTNGMTARKRDAGENFGHPVLLDGAGRATPDPAVFFADPPGSLLPLGGVEAGHKGFALGLLIEALTSALSGWGRHDGDAEWGANVFVLVIDPRRFGGLPAFEGETAWMAEAVRTNPPIPGGAPPRLPGERGLQRRAEQLAHGVALHPSIPPMLAARAERLGVAMPRPI